jgi:ATP-dependent RNA helicase DeaD
MNEFAALGLDPRLVEALTTLGYEAPTPIQQRTIPLLLAGGDVIGQAQTGTGKTAAFALPILQTIQPKTRTTQALVLTPTRELAMQVAEAIHSYASKMEQVSVVPLYGGAPIVPQLKRLDRGVHVVVGTPGRLIDHLDRGSLSLANIKLIVLDEADEMLKMGFIEEVERILASAPAERQIALFSATMPDEVMRIAQRHLRNPERIEIEHKSVAAPAIEQRFLNVSEGQKLEVLTQILEIEPSEAALIFRRTKTGAAELAEKLEARGFAAVAMHGDMTQTLRESVIRRLRAGQVEIVVATDVAARGLDVEQISHVVNYDVPYDVEAYVHRIGRTGRAGRSGIATLFVTPRERRMMREIERYTGTQIKPMKIPTRADVAAARVAVFKETIRKTIGEGDLDLYVGLVEQLVEEGPFDVTEVAAAAAKIANSQRSLVAAPEPPAQAAVSSSAPPSDRPDKTVRLSMAVGKRDGIRPADIVGSIANEADIPGRDIGPIDIREDITYVGVPERHVEIVLAKVGHAKFRGRKVNIRVAGNEPPPPARRPDRPDRYDRPDRPDRPPGPPRYGARADRPAARPDRDRPPRPDRDHATRPDRPSRPDRDHATRPDRPSRPGGFQRRDRDERDRGPARPGTGSRPGPRDTPFYAGAKKGTKRKR